MVKIDAPAIIKMLGASGVEVLGIGPFELGVGARLGKDFLFKIMNRTPINVVAANVPGFLPYVRLRKGEKQLKILVTSVIDPILLKQYGINYEDQLVDPVAALHRILKNVSYDFAVVIVHASRARMAEIVKKSPRIDLVVDGETMGVGDNLNPPKSRYSKKWITRLGIENPVVYNNKRGQVVCYLDIETKGSKFYRIMPPQVEVALVTKVNPDPEIEKMVADYHREREEYFAQRRREREKRYMEKHPQNMFLGDRGCQGCHPLVWEQWRKSRHSQALESLRQKKRLKDDGCLKCHVTGMDVPNTVGGFSSVRQTPWMAGVQCEACHGAGARHAQDPKLSRMAPVGKFKCMKCHDAENDPEFSFEHKWKKIVH